MKGGRGRGRHRRCRCCCRHLIFTFTCLHGSSRVYLRQIFYSWIPFLLPTLTCFQASNISPWPDIYFAEHWERMTLLV
uniref:Uncharacterized protein n=1 Tax=Octopus bimaculoides TaxID=37653 RepID=A0A0L8GX93_OCTBM